MKILSKQRLGLACLIAWGCSTLLPAQEQREIIVIKDGALISAPAEKNTDVSDKEHVIVRWGGDKEARAFRWNKSEFSAHRNPCKVFIGVGTSRLDGGLHVDYTVDDTPASQYGVQTGDIILALDGVPVTTQSELVHERDKHQQGDPFTLTVLRNGEKVRIDARFKACSEEEMEQMKQREAEQALHVEEMIERMSTLNSVYREKDGSKAFTRIEKMERPILGVYEDESISVPGMVIGSVIPGKGAEAAGLKAGDIVVKANGKSVTSGGTLRSALSGRKPGDRIAVEYRRDGQTFQTEVTLSADRSFYSFTTERDPCAVFIGVYTSDHGIDGRGVRVTGIVDDTPAKHNGVQVGDIILELDGQAVNTHEELRRERDKHKPGDRFRMSVMRDGAYLNIDAVFKECPAGNNPVTMEEKVELISEARPVDQRRDGPSGIEDLRLESLELYPNPTAGPLTVRFEAEAVPTTVQIMDAAGKVVYNNTLPQFNGYFNERLDLSGNTPGTYVLSIQQKGKNSTRKIILMPRA